MKKATTNPPALDPVLGSLGIVLIALLAWACEPDSASRNPLVNQVRRAAAWLVIRSVVAFGSAIDRIAPVEIRAERTEGTSSRTAGHNVEPCIHTDRNRRAISSLQ
jgi:hypothetical protein